MAENKISRLSTNQAKQKAKLTIVMAKRQDKTVSRNGTKWGLQKQQE
jgi:hypothetical protein